MIRTKKLTKCFGLSLAVEVPLNKHTFLTLIAFLFLSISRPGTAYAGDEPELTLKLTRVFGYSSGVGREVREMQGTFSMKVTGPVDLERVVFYLDDTVLGEGTTAPFQLRFVTGNYPEGVHTLHAAGFTAGGRELHSEVIKARFTPPSRTLQVAAWILVPAAVLILGGMGVAAVITKVASRGKPAVPLGAQQQYGASGGAICPKCKRPFPMHFWAPNLGPYHHFDRCPHCGRWSLARRRSTSDLRAAEAVERASLPEVRQVDEDERLRRQLEESRFQE